MPSYPLAASQDRYQLGHYTVTYGDDGDIAWAGECGDNSQDIVTNSDVHYYTITSGGKRVNITRNVLFFDTTGLSPSLEIETAGIWAYTGEISGASHVEDWVRIVTCPDVHRPCIESDYGYLGNCNTVVASLFVPTDLSAKYRYLSLDANGIAAINSGGITPFGIKTGKDMSVSFPGWNRIFRCNFAEGAPTHPCYLYINQPVLIGYIWVEGTNLAYLDAYRDKRLKEGTKEGATSETAGHLWVEGNNLRYIDSSGDERYITGTQEGATGQTGGHIWIEGANLRYIDSSGNERYLVGS